MAITPDNSRFTACVIGEATPEEQSSFEAALPTSAALREEAAALSRTANRLAHALQGETPVSLTGLQRNHVLQQGAPGMLGHRRKNTRPAWFGPTWATAGIAATLALGFYALPDKMKENPSQAPEQGILSVALEPRPISEAGPRPVAPPPPVAAGAPASPVLGASSPAKPVVVKQAAAMTATPPVLRVPAPVPSNQGPIREPVVPGRPLPGKVIPVESFAGPQVLPP